MRREGIRFDSHRRAHPAQRLTATELADLIGMERDPDVPAAAQNEEGGPSSRFDQQLHSQTTSVADAVEDLLAGWRNLGGDISYGRAAETSAILYYLPYQHRGHILWTAVIYPLIGTLEISFQHLKSKEPFTDPSLRDELRLRLNEAPGVDIAPAKIALRPSIRLEQLQSADTRHGVLAAFQWLTETAQADRPSPEAAIIAV